MLLNTWRDADRRNRKVTRGLLSGTDATPVVRVQWLAPCDECGHVREAKLTLMESFLLPEHVDLTRNVLGTVIAAQRCKCAQEVH